MKGVTLNFSKKGVSLSAGPKGLKATIGNGRTRITAGIPGTGISYSQSFSNNSSQQPGQVSRVRAWIGAFLYIVLGLCFALSAIGSIIGFIISIFDGSFSKEHLYALIFCIGIGLLSLWCFQKAMPIIREIKEKAVAYFADKTAFYQRTEERTSESLSNDF